MPVPQVVRARTVRSPARTPQARIFEIVRRLEGARSAPGGVSRWRRIANRAIFEAQVRYEDFRESGDPDTMASRLATWMSNGGSTADCRGLLTVIESLLFVDKQQMAALYRAAYRGPVTRWLVSEALPLGFHLDNHFDRSVRQIAASYQFCSVSDSFDTHHFLRMNGVSGDSFHLEVGDRARRSLIRGIRSNLSGVIVLEDFVGTGNKAHDALGAILANPKVPCQHVLFVPLVIMEDGLSRLSAAYHGRDVTIDPVLVIPNRETVRPRRSRGEPVSHKAIRKLVLNTGSRVLERSGPMDVPPSSEFGFEDSGLMYASYENCPDNTLPLISHEAPRWRALFNRVDR